ncbi:DegT/DnrJ/EryC1/StrS family aminotransferase [Thiohalomonas denitrificans]|uniref:UDP-2-acetamido-2-deoxy-ribo-hexuluronate aminotransferase n=1 Tax=Thiohalomonas denitrificans TaxID=415747 RepID=A0A1G5QIV0_9GAMM|nr:DegT/DnrJ/EryC1/StrS family aminotransferase [Thiohalomonas denitrificans]SCZ61538.1 UDP-2-acetamido-2-deoxy-ribo-hexuluronate aminotransferase [Thiohalomonas denitrificans]
MQFIDLESQQKSIRPRLEARIRRVLDHGRYIMGPEVAELEERLAEYAGVKHCVAVSSGTDSLLIAMMALGIGPGDEVITTPFTFIATGEVIALLGAMPVFVDIDFRTYNIDPEKIETKITSKTRAIMPVSLYGQCADFDTINAIAARYGLPVIEDGAQSFGATYKGRKSCGLSTVGSTSFFPSKPLGGYGDSGALFTDEDELAQAMREIRVHGQDRRYHHPVIGINGRINTIQAAILLEKLEIFPQEVVNRARIGAEYGRQLAALSGIAPLYIEPYHTSVYAQYTVQVEDRDQIARQLKSRGIPTAVHYPVSLCRQPVFSGLNLDPSACPQAEQASARVLSLPMHPYLDPKEQHSVVDALASATQLSVS